jgi:hypothetical protein
VVEYLELMDEVMAELIESIDEEERRKNQRIARSIRG